MRSAPRSFANQYGTLPRSFAGLVKGCGVREKRGFPGAALTPKWLRNHLRYLLRPDSRAYRTNLACAVVNVQWGKRVRGYRVFGRAVKGRKYGKVFPPLPQPIRPPTARGRRQTGMWMSWELYHRGKSSTTVVKRSHRSERDEEIERFVNEPDVVNGISNQNGPMEVFSRI